MTEHTMLPPLSTLMRPAIPAMMPSEDNWKGKTSPAERRKIQNKLNQRTWRQRRKQEKQQQQQQQRQEAAHNPGAPSPSSSSSMSSSPSSSPSSQAPTGALVPTSRWAAEAAAAAAPPAFTANGDNDAGMQLSRSGPPRRVKNQRVCALTATLTALEYLGRARPLIELREEDMDDLHDLFLQRAYESRARRGPGSGSDPMADSLLPLVQFNLFRGLMENSKTLGITLSMICDDDCISPYGSDPAYGTAAGGWAAALPSSLRPTRTQLTAAHHPWLDLLPLPRMRDNLIEAGSALDEDELCLDLIGNGDAPSGQGGMILWGEPWDPRSWEVTEEFVERWRWLLEGCGELVASSNYWRAKRGERKMRVKLSYDGEPAHNGA
ncbi:hypothetical protein LZ31DRAFT_514312 [Colletotrichum somersetense]|nr:hypothetical protein LZ31DRAFT_514312 [Colletotrichum somersetense]